MTEFMIVGDENIAASRILVPVAIATVLPNVVMPVTGTVVTTTSSTLTVGTITALGTILSPIAVVGTVVTQGTISVGTVTAVVDIGTVNVVGTLDSVFYMGTVAQVGTLLNAPLVTVQGTVLAQGTLTVGTVLSPVVVVGTVQTQATIVALGTILSPIAVVGTVQSQAASYVFTNVSSVVKGTPGVLYMVNAAGETGLVAGAGTLLVLDVSATVTVVPVAAGGYVSAPFGPGVTFSSLIASIIGDVDATFVVR